MMSLDIVRYFVAMPVLQRRMQVDSHLALKIVKICSEEETLNIDNFSNHFPHPVVVIGMGCNVQVLNGL